MVDKINYFLKQNPSAIQIIIFVSVVLVLFMVIVVNSLEIVQQRYQITQLEESVFELENENKLLIEKSQKTSTERYIEEIARERLGMVKSGEIPVQVNETVVQKKVVEENILDSKDKAGMYLKSWYVELGEWFSDAKK